MIIQNPETHIHTHISIYACVHLFLQVAGQRSTDARASMQGEKCEHTNAHLQAHKYVRTYMHLVYAYRFRRMYTHIENMFVCMIIIDRYMFKFDCG